MSTLYILTHGRHQKGGDTAETYDGHLTDDGRASIIRYVVSHGAQKQKSSRAKRTPETLAATINRLPLNPKDCDNFCGPQVRQRESALLFLRFFTDYPNTKPIPFVIDERLAKDEWVFSMKNDDRFIDGFANFLEERRQQDKDTMIFSSRVLPVAMRYLQGGGKDKFGPFANFLIAYEDAATSPDADLVIMKQGNVTEWEI